MYQLLIQVRFIFIKEYKKKIKFIENLKKFHPIKDIKENSKYDLIEKKLNVVNAKTNKEKLKEILSVTKIKKTLLNLDYI